MQAQAKAIKSTWSAACGNGSGCIRFQGTNKRPDEGEELNALVTSAVKEILKSNKRVKSKAENDSGSEEEQEKFNSEDLKIGEE